MSIPDPIVLLDARARYVHPAFQMSRASTKTVFDSAGRLVTVPANALGWDHDPATGQSRGYLAEPAATNLLLHSNDLTEGVWGKDRVTIGSPISGPDGADVGKLVESSEAGTHGVRQVAAISDGSSVAVRFIARAGERSTISLRLGDDTDMSTRMQVDINLTDGSFSTAYVGGASIAAVDVRYIGSGYYACRCTGTLGSGVTAARLQVLVTHEESSSYVGDGVSGLYLGYFQAEEGSHPTSYIETAGSTATRVADALVLPSLSSYPWWAGGRGALLLDYELINTAALGKIAEIGSALTLRYNSGGSAIILAGDSVSARNIMTDGSQERRRRCVAIAFDSQRYVVVYDGGAPLSGDVLVPISGTPLRILSAPPISGFVRRVAYYPARPSNADLQSLTAIQE